MSQASHVRLGDVAHEVSAKATEDLQPPVFSVTKHQGFVPSLEFFTKQVFSRDTSGYKLVRRNQFAYATIHLDEGALGLLTTADAVLISPMYTVFEIEEERVYPPYLFRALKAPQMLSIYGRLGRGSVHRRRSISFERLAGVSIPLPPLAEQRRIAEVLDRADAIRRKRKEAIALTGELLRSAFLEMFGDPVTNPKGWKVGAIGDYAERVTKGESPGWQGFEYQEEGVRFVTSENVLWGSVDLEKAKFVPPAFDAKIERSRLRVDDVLVNLVGASVGRTALVPSEALPANINQAVAVVTLRREQLAPEFLLHQLLTSAMQHRLLGNVVDAARANISLTNIRELEVVVPPPKDQERWGTFIRAVQGHVGGQRAASIESDQLLSALVQQSFSEAQVRARAREGAR